MKTKKPIYIEIDEHERWNYYSDKQMTKLHREDGPAEICPDGTKSWWINGHLHNEQGPAVIWADGTKYWYLNGRAYSEHQWKKKVNAKKATPSCANKIVEIEGKKYKLVPAT